MTFSVAIQYIKLSSTSMCGILRYCSVSTRRHGFTCTFPALPHIPHRAQACTATVHRIQERGDGN